MKKAKYFLSGIIAITLLLTTTATALTISNTSRGPILKVTTDKYVYLSGEPVTIFLTNVGDETLCGGGPIITIYDENDNIVYQEATYCWHELEPGEYIEWPPWDQTDQYGNQVPDGEYTAEGYLSDGNGGGWVDDAIFYIGNYNGDELDQSQTVMTEDTAMPVGQIPIPDNPINFQVAQSFIPTKEILTRVELFIGKNITTTFPYVVAIREELTEDDLTTASVDPEDINTLDISNETLNLSWIGFNFDDVMVTTGQTYYIVSYTENTTDNFYAWGADNESDPYPFGCAWMSIDDGDTWSNESVPAQQPSNVETSVKTAGREPLDGNETWDMCFKTYGRSNSPPDAPVISGETNGEINVEYEYTFVANDPDDDDLYYWIEWGDGSPAVEWTGSYASGEIVTVSHTFTSEGTYIISAKAKDVFDAEGDWGYLQVTMPVNQQSSQSGFNVYFKFLQRFSQTFPLVRTLLGL